MYQVYLTSTSPRCPDLRESTGGGTMTPVRVKPSNLEFLRLQNEADDTALEYDHFKVAIFQAADRKFMAKRRLARFIAKQAAQQTPREDGSDERRWR